MKTISEVTYANMLASIETFVHNQLKAAEVPFREEVVFEDIDNMLQRYIDVEHEYNY
jgi:hypothetical protein